MRIYPQHVVVLLGLMLLAVAECAEAQPAVPDCSADPQCLSLYDRARQESDGGNLAEAERFYKLAYEVKADPRLLFSIARVLHKGSRLQEAASFYLQFIDSLLNDPEQKRKAQQYLAQLHQPTQKTGRPRWRLILGGATIGAGLLLAGFGVSAFVANGRCIDTPSFPDRTCESLYMTGSIGGALIGIGAAGVVGGVLLMAWPGK